jgi:hypothetical protein
MHVYGVAHHAIAVPARKEQAGLSALAVRVSNQVKVVRTWGDLTQQPTIDAGDGVSVRLGIGASHGPLNSGVLLYCLADGYNYFEHPNITLAGLGPLSVSMRRGEESLVVTDIGTPVMLSYKGWNTVQGCTLFFAKSVLIDAPGRYEITVRAASGRVLARTAIASDDSFYHPWTPFLMAEDSEWEWVSHWDYTFRQTKPAVLSVPGVGIAINAWGGENLQVFSGHANLGYDLRGEKFKPRNPAALLPSLVPTRPDPHLKLSVQHGFVTITSRTPIDCARPDWRLIARWWVNDEPFIPRPGHAPEFGGGETGYSKMKQLCFRLNLEPARLGAHSGDRVALQILICDDWCYVENPGTTLRSFADGKARLTNKVEFVLK